MYYEPEGHVDMVRTEWLDEVEPRLLELEVFSERVT